jgi:hypothetical protein
MALMTTTLLVIIVQLIQPEFQFYETFSVALTQSSLSYLIFSIPISDPSRYMLLSINFADDIDYESIIEYRLLQNNGQI